MAIKVYCNRGLYDDETSHCLTEGDICDSLSYWNNGVKITKNNVLIKCIINDDEIIIELDDYQELLLNVDDIIEWN